MPTSPVAAFEALEALDFFVRAADVRPAWPKLAILVEEVVMNLVDHGGAPAGDPIALGFALHAGGVRVTIEDGARAWDPRGRSAAFDADRVGGAGIHLIEAWSTVEDYASADGRNRLVMWVPL